MKPIVLTQDGESSCNIWRKAWTLCYLFIPLFLQDLFTLSKVRGAAKECVSSVQEKNPYSVGMPLLKPFVSSAWVI